MVNPKILKMNSRGTVLKIHGYMFLTSFFALIVSIALDDRPITKNVDSIVVDADTKNTVDIPLANTTPKELFNGHGESRQEFSDSKLITRHLNRDEIIDRLNNVFILNNISIELEEVGYKDFAKTIEYKFESDGGKVSCTIAVLKETGKAVNMLCFVKHNLGDKENEKIVEGIIDSVGQSVFAIVDRNAINGLLPRFDGGDIILTLGIEELGNLLKFSHQYTIGEVESYIVILLVSSPEFDSEQRRIPLNFVVIPEPKLN
jgi:hypothetical protein